MRCIYNYIDANTLFSTVLSLLVTLAQAQDYTSCAFLHHYISEHPECEILDYGRLCSGVSCHGYAINTDFIVRKCQDPITVDMFVEFYDEFRDFSREFYYIYDHSETVNYRQKSYTGILERNATHLGFMVSVYKKNNRGGRDV